MSKFKVGDVLHFTQIRERNIRSLIRIDRIYKDQYGYTNLFSWSKGGYDSQGKALQATIDAEWSLVPDGLDRILEKL